MKKKRKRKKKKRKGVKERVCNGKQCNVRGRDIW